MAIRKRDKSLFEADFAEVEGRVLWDIETRGLVDNPMIDGFQPDNVIPISRADDARGTFNRRNDPFPGSAIAHLTGGKREVAGAVSRHIAYTQPETVQYPNEMRVQDLLAQVRIPYEPRDESEKAYRARIRSPLTAIRAWCVNSQGGSPAAVKACDVMECPFWPFRMGRNSFRGRV